MRKKIVFKHVGASVEGIVFLDNIGQILFSGKNVKIFVNNTVTIYRTDISEIRDLILDFIDSTLETMIIDTVFEREVYVLAQGLPKCKF